MKLNSPLTKFEQDLIDEYQLTLKKAEDLKAKLLESSENLGVVTASFNVFLSFRIEVTSHSNAELTRNILLKDTNNSVLKKEIHKEILKELWTLIDTGTITDSISIEVD